VVVSFDGMVYGIHPSCLDVDIKRSIMGLVRVEATRQKPLEEEEPSS